MERTLFSRIVAEVANAPELADLIGIPKAKELVDRALHRAVWAVEKQGGRILKMGITHLVAEVPHGLEDATTQEIIVRAQSVLVPPPLRLVIEVRKDEGSDDDAVAIVRHGFREYPLAPDSRLHIGREPGNQIILTGKSVSRQHGQIVATGNGIVYTDRSANGTWVQLFETGLPFHVRAETVELPNGAILTIGRCREDNEAGERVEIHPAETRLAIPRAA